MNAYRVLQLICGPYFFSRKRRTLIYRLPKSVRKQLFIHAVRYLLKGFSLNSVYAKRNPCKAKSLVEVTNVCNLNCAMCNTRLSVRAKGFISADTFEIILQKLKSAGSNTIGLFTVGEPLLHPEIKTLLELVDKYRFKALLSTNGQFPMLIPELYQDIPSRDIVYRFSIDGALQKTYESIRREASFSTLMESLEQVHQLNQAKIDSRIRLFIRVVLCMRNIYEIPQFFNIFGKYCFPEHFTFDIIQGLSPDLTFFEKEFPFKHLIRRNVPCSMPFSEMNFTYDGKATVCPRDYSGRLVIGDIRKESITELWNGNKANEIRKLHLQGGKTGLPCDECYSSINSIHVIVNLYIRFLNFFCRQMSSDEFGDKLVSLLEKMDSALAQKDLSGFKKQVLNAFLK